ncbi:MAG TPA: DinB family protein [Pyrinomonadaceae bacterium]|nr:DinB family protein [Pyrinomonadaceae bacterium]
MPINEGFLKEVEQESIATRKMLERIPAETFDWKPHEKSMTMKRLAGLTADMFGWLSFMIDEPELDFAKGYEQPNPQTTQDLVNFFDKRYADGIKSLKNAEDAVFSEKWTLRNGDDIYMVSSKLDVIRQTINHMIHHRGQLSVFMRLKDIAIPPIYGPSADEGQM